MLKRVFTIMSKKLTVPAHGHAKQIEISMEKIKNAENRLHEAQFVNAGTYSELEFTYNEAYRDCRKILADIQLQQTKVLKNIEERKADIVLDVIPNMLEGQPKSNNNSDFRNAVIARDEEYQGYLEHMNKLKALESHFSGILDTMVNTCRYMKKQMDLIIKAGYVPPVKNTGDKL